MVKRSSNKVFIKSRNKQLSKFTKLCKPKNKNNQQQTTGTVINLSCRELTKDEEDVLKLGLNFSIAPRKIPKEAIVQQIEPALYKLPNVTADKVRIQITETLRQANPPKSNLNTAELKAIKSLRSDDKIHILKADKGNATVVMNKEDYDFKVKELLSSSTYKKLGRDPTPAIERKVSKHLLSLNKTGHLSNNLYRRLHPSASTCPKFYGLPKVHKPEIPLRPIVASRGSPTYDLAQHLTHILEPLVGNSLHSVINSSSFITEIKDFHLDENDILVSFDIVSLFTNVPVQETCNLIKEKLLGDSTLQNRTELSVDEIVSLLELCLNSTCFQWRDSFFEQTSGAAMGSPLSPIIANLFMEHFEKEVMSSSSQLPKVWKRFVDDIFAIWSHGKEQLDNFLKYLNSIHPSIKFTMEVEDDNQSLAFLDINITRKQDGSLAHSVYRKPTHTDRYLHYRSFHHPRILSSVCKTLVHRAYSVCDSDNINNELKHLSHVLQMNGFPENRIVLQKPLTSNRLPDESISSVCIPYIGASSHKIERILQQNNIKVYHTSQTKIQQLLFSHKDKVDDNLKPGVYRIPCNCGMVYIGETGRNLKTRLKEHQDCCRKSKTEKSAVAKHAWEQDHIIDWKEAKLLAPVQNYFARQTRESIEIAKHKTMPQEGKPLSGTWATLF